MSDMIFVGTLLLALIGMATFGLIMWLIFAPLGITEAAAQDRCAIARIQPDECWHLMEDR